MAIQLVTFGGLRAFDDSGELRGLLGQNTRAARLAQIWSGARIARQ
jgi:hypothetical protein